MSGARSRVLAAGAIAFALSVGYLAQGTFAAGTPANKVGAAGSTTEELGPNTSRAVLTKFVKINNPTDLIIGVSAECAIETSVTNGADGKEETAFGQISFHVEIDDKFVPVATGDKTGEITFCSRTQSQKWVDGSSDNEDLNDKLTQHTATRDANAFNWMALNIGENYPGTADNVHKIEVVATWKTTVSNADGLANAIVGRRTMVLEPVKAAHGDTVSDATPVS